MLANAAYIHININPIALHLGPLELRWYGIMYVVAIYVAARVCQRIIPYFQADEEDLWRMLSWCIPAGLIGGRLYYDIQNNQSYYLHNPQHILAFWEGGMAFFGAIIAVAATVLVYARVRHLSLWPLLDVGAVFAAVGQPIGRIGNIINGDIVGYATHKPWGFVYGNPHSLAPQLGVAYQPAPVFEIIANVILIFALWQILRRWRPPGLCASLYLAGYAITQFIVFFGRDNSITVLGLKQAQLTSIAAFAIAGALLWQASRSWNNPAPSRPTPAATANV